MTTTMQAVMEELESSGSSEALTVADGLRTIAGNGDEQAEDSYLLGCADEIAGWAKEVKTRYAQRKKAELKKKRR